MKGSAIGAPVDFKDAHAARTVEPRVVGTCPRPAQIGYSCFPPIYGGASLTGQQDLAPVILPEDLVAEKVAERREDETAVVLRQAPTVGHAGIGRVAPSRSARFALTL